MCSAHLTVQKRMHDTVWNFVWQQTIFTCEWIVSALPSRQFQVLFQIECSLNGRIRDQIYGFYWNFVKLPFRHNKEPGITYTIIFYTFIPFVSFEFHSMFVDYVINSINYIKLRIKALFKLSAYSLPSDPFFMFHTNFSYQVSSFHSLQCIRIVWLCICWQNW